MYRNYYLFAQTLLDRIIVQRGNDIPFTFELEGEENLRALVQKGRGGLLMSAHIGNWEVAAQLLGDFRTKVNIVMFDEEHRALKEYLDNITGGRKVNVIPVKDDLSHIYSIGEALQSNELVCLHADRFLPGNKTRVMNFFSAPAEFPIGPFALASTFRVPVSFVFGIKESATHYHLFGGPMLEFEESLPKEAVVDKLMTLFIKRFEEMVRCYPEHWFNYYDFWQK
ncbi:MAG: lipid A biosynthesis acyltransferase [Cyclobacteriaceae bacterium]